VYAVVDVEVDRYVGVDVDIDAAVDADAGVYAAIGECGDAVVDVAGTVYMCVVAMVLSGTVIL